MIVRYYYCPDDIYHPMIYDDRDKLCYCISCIFTRSFIVSLMDFKNSHSPNIVPVTLPVLAVWIDRFKNATYYEFRKDKIKEIAKYLLINTDSV